jgi:hypothetical protein
MKILNLVSCIRSREPFKQETRMSAAYLASLRTCADTVGTPLTLAIFGRSGTSGRSFRRVAFAVQTVACALR